jgi:GNAT superfamily N-acetyltransferase
MKYMPLRSKLAVEVSKVRYEELSTAKQRQLKRVGVRSLEIDLSDIPKWWTSGDSLFIATSQMAERVVGFGILRSPRREPEFRLLGVNPNLHNRGVGTALVGRILEEVLADQSTATLSVFYPTDASMRILRRELGRLRRQGVFSGYRTQKTEDKDLLVTFRR